MQRLCKNGWIETYVEYTHNQESPTAFHQWAGLCILSAAIGRNIWIPRIKYTIFPNIFVILVAGSAKCKKSTSIKISEKILKSIDNSPMIFSQRITTEALIEAMELAKVGGSSSGIIIADELSVFMGAGSKESGIIPLLTTLYDSPEEWSYHTRSRGKEVLKNVSLTILAGTTKVWLKSAIPADSIAGGFASRIIFVYQEMPTRPILFYDETPYELELRKNLINDLMIIRKTVGGAIEFSYEARAVAEKWYTEEFYKIRDEKVDGYFSRKHDTMFKIATLLSLSDSSKKIIEAKHITQALKLMEENEKHMDFILSSMINTEVGDVTERILELIRKHGRLAHTEILRKCWRYADSQQISLLIKTLLESGEITETLSDDNRARYYKIRPR
jgi:hypothetical protein